MKDERNRYVYPVLGEKFRCLLKELGVSQQELSTAASMSKSTLQKCLKGEDVRISDYIRLLDALCFLLGEAECGLLRRLLCREIGCLFVERQKIIIENG